MLYRTTIFKIFLIILDYAFPDKNKFFLKLNRIIKKALNTVNRQQFVYFTNHDDVATLNKVLLYISENESTRRVKIVSIINDNEPLAINLRKDIETLDRAYPLINVEFIEEPGVFGPEKIQELSNRWHIPTNFMFIASPGHKFPYKIQELGEVRLII